MAVKTVLRKRHWTPEGLMIEGFQYAYRRKQLVMMRSLPESEAPLVIEWPLERLSIPAGYCICFDPGSTPRDSLYAYKHWPVLPVDFWSTYCPWDDPAWRPSLTEQHLLALGCKPFYKRTGVWARRAAETMYVQSIESLAPIPVHAGMWVLVGEVNDPYYMGDADFRARYLVPASGAES